MEHLATKSLATLVLAHINQMTPLEKRQSLVDAGILTEKGNVKKVYKPIFKQQPPKK